MQITISIPDRPFVAEPHDSVASKIRLHAALVLHQINHTAPSCRLF